MAKPRVFVSSTYYDLKHIRNSLEAFIDGMGYESVLFEDGDIPFHHDAPLDISCYEEIKNCHILVLIIGGRYGSPASEPDAEHGLEFYNSVTKKEYETARKNDIPIYIFIEKNVHSEYRTYKKNRKNQNIEYAHVDNVNIFKLIDDIYSQKRNNVIKDFEKFDDLSSWLKDQWAGLFADLLSDKKRDKDLEDLSAQVSGLKELSSVLKNYTESIMEKLQPENFEEIITSSNKALRESQIQIFENHPMIKYIIAMSTKKIGVDELYSAFEQSKTVGDFLRSAGYSDDFVNEMEKNEGAHRDYAIIKKEVG
ncbi:TPA: DUF4062 domain-containing protein [Aeromonas salmonicida]|nr:DUF4062 domain-containing protein [Aeromonas salmonicida]